MQTTSSNETDSWTVAKDLAKKVGTLPSSFTVIIRVLVEDQAKYGDRLTPATKYQVARLLRTPSFKAMLYFCAKAVHPQKLKDKQTLQVGDLMGLFSAFDIAALVGCYAIYRRLRKIVPSEDWNTIQPALDDSSQLSASICNAIPRIGFGLGLIYGTLPLVSRCMLLGKNRAPYEQYIKHLEAQGKLLDAEREQSIWPCTSLQISTMLLSILGYGTDMGQGLLLGLSEKSALAQLQVDSWAYRVKMAQLWTDCTRAGQEQPMEKIPGEYYPLKVARDICDATYKEAKHGAMHWLGRGSRDVTPELMPEFFVVKKAAGDDDLNVPAELADVFSVEEICAMEEEDFDKLLDHIDERAKTAKNILSTKDIDSLENMD